MTSLIRAFNSHHVPTAVVALVIGLTCCSAPSQGSSSATTATVKEIQDVTMGMAEALNARVVDQAPLEARDVGPGTFRGRGPDEMCKFVELEYTDITSLVVMERIQNHAAYGYPPTGVTAKSTGGTKFTLLRKESPKFSLCRLEVEVDKVTATRAELIAIYGNGAVEGCLTDRRPEFSALVGSFHLRGVVMHCHLEDVVNTLSVAFGDNFFELMFSPLGEIRVANRTGLWPWIEGPPWKTTEGEAR